MTTVFKQVTTVASGPLTGDYLWSNVTNWTIGVPVDGDSVVTALIGDDDIAALNLASLTLDGGGIVYVIGSSLSVTTVAVSGSDGLLADATAASGPVNVTVGSVTGTDGSFAAYGVGGVFVDQSATDIGENYIVGSGGLLELAATPSSLSLLSYDGAGTFALENPGASNAVTLSNVASGDVLELPGSSVSSVSFGATSLSVTTNDGTYAFSDVNYAAGPLTSYSAAQDATTGLEAITLLATDTFEYTTQAVSGPLTGRFLWSYATNWSLGVPPDGDSVVVGSGLTSYDDVAALNLTSLTLVEGGLIDVVGSSLSLGAITFANNGGGELVADAATAGAPVTVTVGSISGSDADLEALGAGGVFVDQSATDIGENYIAGGGGLLELAATPSSLSLLSYDGAGTFALENPGASNAVTLLNVANGDVLELPGSSVSSVSFGATSLSVTTNDGTYAFSDVNYAAGPLTSYSAAQDATTGLEAITLLATDTFQQTETTPVDGTGVYLWSDPNNWSSGVPTNGTLVSVGISASPNPGSYDDLANLEVSQLYLTAGYIAVAGTLTVDNLNLNNATNNQGVASDTLIDNDAAPALLTIDNIVGSGAYIDADGRNAETVVNATDTGNTYDVAGGGLVELNTSPNANSAFVYSSDPTDSGTFAFPDAGSTMAELLQNVGPGDSVELPGSSILAVNADTVDGILTVTTNLGITTFNDVAYQPDLVVTGYTASADPATGLEKVTLNGYETTNFLQTVAYHVTYNGSHFELFTWTNDSNWDNGVPTDGGYVTVDVTSGASPQSYDDIADLSLTALNLVAGSVAVGLAYDSNLGASLDVGSLGFGPASASIFSDSEIGAPSATLTIDGFTGSNIGIIGAYGSGAITEIDAATDPGEYYQVDQGGELLLDPAPNSSPGTTGEVFTFENTGTPAGTFAFSNPGATIDAPLTGVEDGDSIALPGDQVDAVTYGASSITIVTNLGTTTFDNVSYNGFPSGWTAQPDAVAGLVDATFGNTQVTEFKQTQASYEYGGTSNDFGIFLWSVLANWTNGIATDGATVTVLAPAGAFPTNVDDINIALSSLDEFYGGLMVAATLDVGILTFGTGHPLIYADTELIGNPATLTIYNIDSDNYGTIAAIGLNAFTGVLTPTDPGETYQVGDYAELELAPTPNATPANPLAAFEYLETPTTPGIASGTFAFVNPGATVGALLANVEIGDSLALPGDFASAVTYGPATLTVVTNLGTTVFDNVTYYPGDVFVSYIQSLDPVSGLVRVTFEGTVTNSFVPTDATAIGGTGAGEFLWSNANNWTNGVPLADSAATFDVPSSAAAPDGYDDIGSLVLSQLNIPTGYAAIGGALEIYTVAASGNFSAGLEADTSIAGGAATITVDSFTSASHMLIGAIGIEAIALVKAPTDPGEIYQASDGGLVVLGPTPNASSVFDLSLGDSTSDTGTIAFENPGSTVAALLADVGVGDAIELPGSSVTSVTFGADSLTVATNLGTTTFSDVTYLSNVLPDDPVPTGYTAIADLTTGLENITFTLCFCKGSLISTPSGEVPVEELAVGDTVVTLRGEHRPITWIGVGRVLATRGRRTVATPVIVRKGALADGVPNADLRVTKGHSLFVDDVLIPVEFLVNHRSIQWDDRAQEVAIYHVELATHDVLIANGAPAESYRDDGNRWLFRNANSGWDQPPQTPCAPVLTGGAIVDQTWRRLLDRAGSRPGLPLTEEPDLHLLVDGCRVDSTHTVGTTYRFRQPSGQRFREVRIVSRAAAPCELGLARDPRVLGVAVRSVTVFAGTRYRTIGADDDRLSEGFHGYEPKLDLRWTDGDAALPADLVNCFDFTTDILVEVAGTARYVAMAESRRIAA